ncbi:N-acetyltransferase [Nocardioides baekrokdamisoli]|uniref:N-acetyltransferase n=1 Tax=Nocardioides baekrokdamisoli TaxID=1804624 RepID=A0A3G9IYI9_9ACTN|nr:GNAT family N-acetyltransferase [Nocardioides baekrokdamisoli]BBH16378.1 N-acetyltransferase [Nocardioides baekrokdamisoli]
MIRLAAIEDASTVAALLDAFNREFDTPTPGPAVLAVRLTHLLAAPTTYAVLAEDPAVGVALVTIRTNVWADGAVALLDELYVVPGQRNGGLGSALLAVVEQTARDRGCDWLEINVDGEDTDARRFYERHGYSHHDEGQTEPQLYYSRDL